jgi:hypothetical protein
MERAIRRIMDTMSVMTDDPEGEVSPERFERFARTISLQIKTMGDITAHNSRVSKSEDKEKYLSYEDLPPPSPEERERIIARLMERYRRVNDSGEIPETS